MSELVLRRCLLISQQSIQVNNLYFSSFLWPVVSAPLGAASPHCGVCGGGSYTPPLRSHHRSAVFAEAVVTPLNKNQIIIILIILFCSKCPSEVKDYKSRQMFICNILTSRNLSDSVLTSRNLSDSVSRKLCKKTTIDHRNC